MSVTASPVPRLSLRREEAAAALGMSDDHFDLRVRPHLKVVRSGRLLLWSVAELEEWLAANAEHTLTERGAP